MPHRDQPVGLLRPNEVHLHGSLRIEEDLRVLGSPCSSRLLDARPTEVALQVLLPARQRWNHRSVVHHRFAEFPRVANRFWNHLRQGHAQEVSRALLVGVNSEKVGHRTREGNIPADLPRLMAVLPIRGLPTRTHTRCQTI